MLTATMILCLGFTLSASPTASDVGKTSIDARELPPMRPIPVKLDHGQATVDLTASAGEKQQYLLIAGSAAHDAPGVPVTFRSHTVDEPHPIEADWPRYDPFWKDFVRSRQWQMQVRRSLRSERARSHSTARFAPERRFFIFTGENDFHNLRNYREVKARLVATGEHCLVYVDEKDLDSGFPMETAEFVVRTFDREVYPLTSNIFGTHRDVDRNGKFAILFTHLLSELSDGKVNLGGFIRGGDFYRDIEPPFSNCCDMMYLNSSTRPGPHLRTLLAHEYTHAITFSEHVFGRYLDEGSQSDEQSWLSEAISHLAENLVGGGWSNLDYRISTFLTHPNEYRLVVPDYYRAGLWRCHGSRGSTYLFLRWCVDRYGNEFLSQLAQSNLVGTENIEVAAQAPFRELFREWSTELSLAELSPAFPSSPALNLFGPLERRVLTGVRHEHLPESGAQVYRLAPTSFLPVRVHVPAGRSLRVQVQIPPECSPQLTLVKLPDDLATVRISVRQTEDKTANSVRLALQQEGGTPVHWETICWERAMLPQVKTSSDYKISKIHDWTDLFASSVSTSGDVMVTQPFTVDIAPNLLVFKALGRDASGRPVSAWGMLEDPPVTEWASP